jgi:hypothetical protein
MAGRRYRTKDPAGTNKAVLVDVQLWLDGVPTDDAGWGVVIYREDVKSFADFEVSLDQAFRDLKAKAFLAMR